MSSAETITVPHLGTSTIGYKFGKPYDAALPTLVMVNSFSTSVELYRPQFADEKLTATANLLAIEPYGHGRTRAGYEQFTYWDSAVANLQVLDALGISAAFVLGTSQGGWVAVRMAMLAPGTVTGIIPLGTSMDYESQRSRDLGCWDGIAFCTPAIDALADPVGEDWMIPGELVDAVLQEGFGDEVPPEERAFWTEESQRNYSGDAGRERLRTISINLRGPRRVARPPGPGAVPGPVDARHGGHGVLRGQRPGRDRAVRQQRRRPAPRRRGRAALPERHAPG